MEQHPHRNHYRSLIITFFLVVCIIVIGVVYNYQDSGRFGTNSLQNKTVRETQTPLPSASSEMPLREPIYSINISNPSATLGDEVKIVVNGNSFGSRPVGFDVLMQIDGVSYDVVSVESLDDEFRIMNFGKPTGITITGILATSVNIASNWEDRSLFELTLKPKSEGVMNITIAESIGNETSKIVTDKNGGYDPKIITAQSESASVDIAK